MQEDRGPAEQLDKPFHMITDEVELRRAFLFLLSEAEDYVKPLAEIADRNYAYYRGIEYDREIPKGAIRPRSRTRLNKDIVESSTFSGTRTSCAWRPRGTNRSRTS